MKFLRIKTAHREHDWVFDRVEKRRQGTTLTVLPAALPRLFG